MTAWEKQQVIEKFRKKYNIADDVDMDDDADAGDEANDELGQGLSAPPDEPEAEEPTDADAEVARASKDLESNSSLMLLGTSSPRPRMSMSASTVGAPSTPMMNAKIPKEQISKRLLMQSGQHLRAKAQAPMLTWNKKVRRRKKNWARLMNPKGQQNQTRPEQENTIGMMTAV